MSNYPERIGLLACERIDLEHSFLHVDWALIWNIALAYEWAKARHDGLPELRAAGVADGMPQRRRRGPGQTATETSFAALAKGAEANARHTLTMIIIRFQRGADPDELRRSIMRLLTGLTLYNKLLTRRRDLEFSIISHSVQRNVDNGSLGLATSRFVLDASAEILMWCVPLAKAAKLVRLVQIGGSATLKGVLAYHDTGSAGAGAIKAGVTGVLGVVGLDKLMTANKMLWITLNMNVRVAGTLFTSAWVDSEDVGRSLASGGADSVGDALLELIPKGRWLKLALPLAKNCALDQLFAPTEKRPGAVLARTGDVAAPAAGASFRSITELCAIEGSVASACDAGYRRVIDVAVREEAVDSPAEPFAGPRAE